MQHYSEETIAGALRDNPNAAAIAREHGLTHKQVWNIARAASIDLTAGRAAKGRHAFSTAQCQRIGAAFKNNPHAGPVAALLTEEFGRPVTRWAVAYQARKQGLLPPLRRHVPPPPPPAASLDIPRTKGPAPNGERTPEQYRAEQHALMQAEQSNQRGARPLPTGHCWNAIIERTPSLAGTRYPRPVLGLKGPTA